MWNTFLPVIDIGTIFVELPQFDWSVTRHFTPDLQIDIARNTLRLLILAAYCLSHIRLNWLRKSFPLLPRFVTRTNEKKRWHPRIYIVYTNGSKIYAHNKILLDRIKHYTWNSNEWNNNPNDTHSYNDIQGVHNFFLPVLN